MLATATVVGGRYLLGPLLGRGGVADVYRADDLRRSVPVAVKVLRNATASDLRRFELEARTLERLDHPAIVRLRDEGEHDGVPYLVLDLVEGEPLSHVLAHGPLPGGDVQRMGAALAGALAHAHELGIVHRDVKPGNVLVGRDKSVWLTDFGIARLVDRSAITSITETGLVIGTAAYLAPEQVRGQAVGPAADVYSLGLVLLECTTGKRAFEGSPTESAMARLERPPDVPALAPWLTSLLAAMTALDPAQRPRAAAVGEAFAHRDATGDRTAVLPAVVDRTEASAAGMAPVRRERAVPRPAGFRRRRRLLAALATVAVGIALIVILLGGKTSGPASSDPSATATTAPPSTTNSPRTTSATPTTAASVATAPSTPPPKPQPPDKHQDKGKGGGGDK